MDPHFLPVDSSLLAHWPFAPLLAVPVPWPAPEAPMVAHGPFQTLPRGPQSPPVPEAVQTAARPVDSHTPPAPARLETPTDAAAPRSPQRKGKDATEKRRRAEKRRLEAKKSKKDKKEKRDKKAKRSKAESSAPKGPRSSSPRRTSSPKDQEPASRDEATDDDGDDDKDSEAFAELAAIADQHESIAAPEEGPPPTDRRRSLTPLPEATSSDAFGVLEDSLAAPDEGAPVRSQNDPADVADPVPPPPRFTSFHRSPRSSSPERSSSAPSDDMAAEELEDPEFEAHLRALRAAVPYRSRAPAEGGAVTPK